MVVIPHEVAARLLGPAALYGRREEPILAIARSDDFTLAKLRDALKRASEIH